MSERTRVAGGSRINGQMKGQASDALRQAEAQRRQQMANNKGKK